VDSVSPREEIKIKNNTTRKTINEYGILVEKPLRTFHLEGREGGKITLIRILRKRL
jgi:hypothetical protein